MTADRKPWPPAERAAARARCEAYDREDEERRPSDRNGPARRIFEVFARTDLPRALDELDAVEAERDALRARVAELEALLVPIQPTPPAVAVVDLGEALKRSMLAPVPRGHCGRCDRCGRTSDGTYHCGCTIATPKRTHCAGCGAPYEGEGVKTSLTILERAVIDRIARGEDPWHERGGSTRIVSQAIGRLKRAGFVAVEIVDGSSEYVVTDAGQAARLVT